MTITIIENGGTPRQIDCESFEFRSNHVLNLIKIKKIDGTEEIIYDVATIKSESDEAMTEAGVEIVKTEETKDGDIKYLNINVSDSEVERNPDVVRLCSDAGILEYVNYKYA